MIFIVMEKHLKYELFFQDFFLLSLLWKTFKIRTVFSRLLPLKFTLDTIFDENNNIGNLSQSGGSWNNNQPLLVNKSCKLEYLVGYYGNHYMAFIKNK